MMVILRDHLNGETAEWLDYEEVDTTDYQEPEPSGNNDACLINNLNDWTAIPWEDS